MNFRDQLARVIARDARYPIEAYAFVLESLKLARNRKLRELRAQAKGKGRSKEPDRGRKSRQRLGETSTPPSGHVNPSVNPSRVV